MTRCRGRGLLLVDSSSEKRGRGWTTGEGRRASRLSSSSKACCIEGSKLLGSRGVHVSIIEECGCDVRCTSAGVRRSRKVIKPGRKGLVAKAVGTSSILLLLLLLAEKIGE